MSRRDPQSLCAAARKETLADGELDTQRDVVLQQFADSGRPRRISEAQAAAADLEGGSSDDVAEPGDPR